MRTVLIGALLATTTVLALYAAEQRHTINTLIELNHSKSQYIDAGCNGRYQGTEEFLPNELPPIERNTK